MAVLLSRRQLMRIGSLGLMGVSLPRLLRANEQGSQAGLRPRADHCVLIFLNGGPSHLDMWDMKPQAPAGIRGEFQPIATSVPGIQLSEHLPKLAQQMHRAQLIRSMHHSVTEAHALAVYTSLTGHDRGDATINVGASGIDYPAPGAVLSLLRPSQGSIVGQVTLPYITKEGAGGPPQPGFFGGYLGRSHDPLFVLQDPNSPEFAVPELTLADGVSAERLAVRHALVQGLDRRLARQAPRDGASQLDRFQARAFDLLTSPQTQRALDINQEPAPVREAYGRNIYGQSVLLARRLIEAGTRMVTISWAPDANATWDTHGGNFKKLKNELLPQFDAACSSLLSELAERGLLERTIVAVLGDFGRTPKINANDGGRDHWNFCYTVMLAGGGFKPGFVYGASDASGAFPADRPVTPGQLVATIYHALGISPETILHDQESRPHRLVAAGDPLLELLV